MDYKGLTSSELADSIGVQRSNVTHVLHNRNKPSFQFISKMLEAYPEINAKWLLLGTGEMLEQQKLSNEKQDQTTLFESQPGTSKTIKHEDSARNYQSFDSSEEKTVEKIQTERNALIASEISNEKEIERIVIFYTDQTFKQYTPTK